MIKRQDAIVPDKKDINGKVHVRHPDGSYLGRVKREDQPVTVRKVFSTTQALVARGWGVRDLARNDEVVEFQTDCFERW